MTGGLGAESGVIKVMIDGRSVAYRTTSGNWLGAELIPLESIAQIEIIRGPASALYGADAFLGVVNIITLPPRRAAPAARAPGIGATGGNPGARFDAVAGGNAGKLRLHAGRCRRGDRIARASCCRRNRRRRSCPAGSATGARRSISRRRSLSLQGRVGYSDERRGHVILSAYAAGLERGGDFAHWAQLDQRVRRRRHRHRHHRRARAAAPERRHAAARDVARSMSRSPPPTSRVACAPPIASRSPATSTTSSAASRTAAPTPRRRRAGSRRRAST